MRFILVILYFAAVHYVLLPRPSPTIDDTVMKEAAVQTQPPSRPTPPVSEKPATQARGWTPPESPQTPPPTNSLVALLSSEDGQTAAITVPRETLNTFPTVAEVPFAPEVVMRLVQIELERLACFTGEPERAWGKRSRTALRRFVARANPGKVREPNAAILRLLRVYPENYCKSCKPGKPACDIDLTGTLPGRANSVGPSFGETRQERPSDEANSYLPPWMRDGAQQKVEDAPYSESFEPTMPSVSPSPTPPPAETRKARRSRRVAPRRGVSRGYARGYNPRPRWTQPRRPSPNFSGWPYTGR